MAGKIHAVKVTDNETKACSAHGKSLGRLYRKSYAVVEPDAQPPQLSQWKMTTPSAETRNPLRIRFAGALDHALVQNQIHITDQHKNVIEGEFRSENFEQGLSFVAKTLWKKGRYFIVASTKLEDIAANSLRGVFDKSLEDNWMPLNQSYVDRAFEILP